MVDLEAAVMHLYEDESLTAELDDPEATALLKWAEAQVERLVAQYPSEDEYDAHFTPLRAFIKRVNKVVGQRADMDGGEMLTMLTRMAETARAVGGQIDDAGIQAAAALLPSLNATAALNALLAWMSPPGATASAVEPPPAPPSPEVAAPAPEAPDDSFDPPPTSFSEDRWTFAPSDNPWRVTPPDTSPSAHDDGDTDVDPQGGSPDPSDPWA
jgi:hypothetical protein